MATVSSITCAAIVISGAAMALAEDVHNGRYENQGRAENGEKREETKEDG